MSLSQEGVIGNRLLMKKMNFLPSVLLAQVSNYSSFMQNDGEKAPTSGIHETGLSTAA